MNNVRHEKLVRREAQAIDGIMDVEITKLPSSILNALRNAGIYTIEQLQYLSEEELYRTMRDEGLGGVAVDKIRDFLCNGSRGGVTTHDPHYLD